jgi:hypothetical protein
MDVPSHPSFNSLAPNVDLCQHTQCDTEKTESHKVITNDMQSIGGHLNSSLLYSTLGIQLWHQRVGVPLQEIQFTSVKSSFLNKCLEDTDTTDNQLTGP